MIAMGILMAKKATRYAPRTERIQCIGVLEDWDGQKGYLVVREIGLRTLLLRSAFMLWGFDARELRNGLCCESKQTE
jgi:hypothetical protein